MILRATPNLRRLAVAGISAFALASAGGPSWAGGTGGDGGNRAGDSSGGHGGKGSDGTVTNANGAVGGVGAGGATGGLGGAPGQDGESDPDNLNLGGGGGGGNAVMGGVPFPPGLGGLHELGASGGKGGSAGLLVTDETHAVLSTPTNGAVGLDGNRLFGFAQGGGGGGGGDGVLVVAPDLSLIVQTDVLGGSGGTGGTQTRGAGGGGGGGAGVVFSTGGAATIAAGATVTGGSGGAGGEGNLPEWHGGGGGGGAGLAGTDLVVINDGVIIGGSGGSSFGEAGAGGVGLIGADLVIVDSGIISGGLSGNEEIRANAITFIGGSNSLELRASGIVTGNVGGAGDNTLILGGSTDGAFDVSLIGSQYLDFSGFTKTGASTWSLTGTTSEATPWHIAEGGLVADSDEALGDPSADVTLSGGGTLLWGAAFDSGRSFVLGAGGGVLDTNGFDATLSGYMDGEGGLTKAGLGTLTLAGSSYYEGATTVSQGTLKLGADYALPDPTDLLIADGATLDLDGYDVSLGSLAGRGTLTTGQDGIVYLYGGGSFDGRLIGGAEAYLLYNGAGAFTLNGSSSFLGAIYANDGRIVSTGISTFGDVLFYGGDFEVAGGKTTLLADIYVSGATSPVLSVTGGGVLEIAEDLYVATYAGEKGLVRVTDANSHLVVRGDLEIAGEGAGALTLADGKVTVGAGTGRVQLSNSSSGAGRFNIGATAGETAAAPGVLEAATITTRRGSGTLLFNHTASDYYFTTTGTAEGDGVTIAGRTAVVHEAGVTHLTGTNTYSGGTWITGGTLSIASDGNLGAAASGLAIGAATLATTASFDSARAVTLSGGAGHLDVAAGTALGLSGELGGSGDLAKQGSGTLILTGDSLGFTGATMVMAGTLLVGSGGSGALGGTVTVDAGATLGGSGTIGGNTSVSGTLAAGNSPGTLSFGADLTLNPGATTVFELNTPGVVGGADNDFVDVEGKLILGGALQASVGGAGYYALFGYGELPPGSTFASTSVTGSGGFDVASSVIGYGSGTDGLVSLMALGEGQTIQFWDGSQMAGNGTVEGGGGIWNATNTNWTGAPGDVGFNGPWGGSVGVFVGAAGTVAVEGTHSFDTLQFKTDGYALTGGALAMNPTSGDFGTLSADAGVTVAIGSVIADGMASTGLAKIGGGTVELSGTNTYSGGTWIDGGTLAVSSDGNLGAAAGRLSIGDATLATTATFTSARAVTLTGGAARLDVGTGTRLGLDGRVGGAGGLIKDGYGTLVLSGTNTYAGGTLLASGTVEVASDANLGAASGALAFNGGMLATTESFVSARDVGVLSTGGFDVAADTVLALTG